jgi:hypothetical protein
LFAASGASRYLAIVIRFPRAAFAALAAAGLTATAASAERSEADEEGVYALRAPLKPCGRTRFLAVYDSHGLTPFGDRLDALLRGHSEAELSSFTLGGASPSWLVRRPISPRGYVYNSCDGKAPLPRSKLQKHDLRTPSLDDLLRVPEGTYDRQVVVLTLGSNVPGDPNVLTPPVEQIVRAIDARPDAVCVWIGPPAIRSWSAGYADKVYTAIRDGIRAAEGAHGARQGPACHLIDSRRYSSYPAGGDGTHLGFTAAGVAAANRWADGVAHELDRILRDGR